MDLTTSPKLKTMEGKGVGVCCSFGMGLGKLISNSIIHTNLHKPNKKLVNA
jgi:hypothetical protein